MTSVKDFSATVCEKVKDLFTGKYHRSSQTVTNDTTVDVENMWDAIIDGDCERIDRLCQELGVNYTDKGGDWNFLHMALLSAAIPPNPDVIRVLVDRGVEVDATDRNDWTPLHFAARSKNCDVIEMLLEQGANPNSVGKKGMTPLHLLFYDMPIKLDAIESLLKHGATPNATYGKRSVRDFVQAIDLPEEAAVLALFDAYKPRQTDCESPQGRNSGE